MTPRIRTFVLLLALALGVPATASANPWASITSAPMCVTDPPATAAVGTDDTTVPGDWVAGSVTVTLRGTGVSGYEWKIDCGPTQTDPTALVTGTGTHSFVHRAQEAGTGDWTPWKEDFVKVDATVPVDTSSIPSGWQTDSAPITIDGTDTGDQSGIATLIYELDGNGQVPVAPNTAFAITDNGSHTLRTKAVDNAGNQSAWRNSIVQVDSAAPVDTTTVPAGWQTTPTVDVSVRGTDTGGSGIAQVEWQLVEDSRSAVVAGPGPVTVTVAGEGTHTLRTRMTDGVGKTSSWKTQTVRIDTVLPTDGTTASTAWLPRTSLDVAVNASDATSGVARVEYKIDGGTAVLVNGNTATATVSGNGEHILETRVVDNAGNTTGWVQRTIRLDSTAPTNTTATAPTAWRQNAYAVRLNGSDENSGVASVEWRVDGGPATSGGLGVTDAYVSGDGTHTLSTRVRDVAGNFSGWRDETIRIDSVKPTDTTTVPATVPGGRKITLTGTDALSGLSGSVEWQLDSGAVKTSPQATISGAGPHVLKTRVQDNAGNWSDWKSFNVTVDGNLPLEDSTAPVDTTSVLGVWYSGPETVTVSANDGDGMGVKLVQYRVDGNPVVSTNGDHVTFTVTDDGVHAIQTRALDNAGNYSAWRSHTLRIDSTLPVDTSALPTEWGHSTALSLTATDATSGVATIEYQVNGGSVTTVNAATATVTLPGDGTYTVRRRITDVAGQQTGWITSTIKIDSVLPTNTSAAAPTAWQTSALQLPLTGTDAGSGFDHGEYRVAGGPVQVGSPAIVTSSGTQTLETRVVDRAGNASAWRSETVKVDLNKPVNTTPAISAPWRNANFATTVSGTDATSGVARVEWKLDNGSVSTSPAVSITAEGTYKLWTRVVDVAGNASDWRVDTVGIDKTAPTLAVDCGTTAWRNTPAPCAVVASGGLSGLASVTGARDGDGPVDASAGLTVEAEGASTLTFRAVDGAGNEVAVPAAVKIDRTPPVVTLSCAADSKSLGYLCTAGGSDALSGLGSLAYSVNGGAPVAVAAGAAFKVAKGKVVVTGADVAGNVGGSAPAELAERHADATPVTARTTSEAVLLKGGGKDVSKRLVGQLALAVTPTATTLDLRPMALGNGTFQLVVKLTAGKKTKTVTKTQKTVGGYTKRVLVRTAADADVKVTLTVKRKSGKRWKTYATSSTHL